MYFPLKRNLKWFGRRKTEVRFPTTCFWFSSAARVEFPFVNHVWVIAELKVMSGISQTLGQTFCHFPWEVWALEFAGHGLIRAQRQSMLIVIYIFNRN